MPLMGASAPGESCGEGCSAMGADAETDADHSDSGHSDADHSDFGHSDADAVGIAADPLCSAGCPTVCMVTMPNSRAANSISCPYVTLLLRALPAMPATLPPAGMWTDGGPVPLRLSAEADGGRRARSVTRVRAVQLRE